MGTCSRARRAVVMRVRWARARRCRGNMRTRRDEGCGSEIEHLGSYHVSKQHTIQLYFSPQLLCTLRSVLHAVIPAVVWLLHRCAYSGSTRRLARR